MHTSEPRATAVLLIVLGAMMGLSVLSSRLAGRAGVPIPILFIGIGMLAGSEGIGGIEFSNYGLAFRLGMVALVLILFDGGLNTPLASARQSLKASAVLATFGVVATALIIAGVARFLFGIPWPYALLLGSTVSSTDAAAVFSVLRGSGLHLKKRLGLTLEMESGLNDPMAVILTVSMTEAILSEHLSLGRLGLKIAVQIAVGLGLGLGLGNLGRWLLDRLRLPAAGLYPVLTTALALLAFGLPTLFEGSGFLAVYIVAMQIGNKVVRYRAGILRVHDALAWLSQVTMFLVLGLLVFPSELLGIFWQGLGLALALALLARPVAALLSLLPFGFRLREIGYIGWVGLRGAVPIILATFPVLSGAPGSRFIFNLVFFIVVVNAFIPGATVRWLTRKMNLVSAAPPAPSAVLEIASTQHLNGEIVSFFIHPASAACDARLMDLPIPEESTVALIVRGEELVAPRGNTKLDSGDHVYVFVRPEDVGLMNLIFGQQEAD
jgi:cell volume regulation protein A